MKLTELTRIPHRILEEAAKAGLDRSGDGRAGTLMHVDQETIFSQVNEAFEGKIEIMDTKQALEKYAWVRDLRWSVVERDKDDYTRKVDEDFSGGYFMRILPGAEIVFPLQSCLMITRPGLEQRIHNIVVAEEGSKAHIISGCIQHSEAREGRHLGISEFFVRKNAYLNFTMIHDWSVDTFVRPRSGALVDDGGTFVSNYVCLRPVKDLQMLPVALCRGKESKAIFTSILYGQEGSLIDVGSKAILTGEGSRSEMTSRVIVRRGSRIIARGLIDGDNKSAYGHLECKGLLLDDESFINSIPELIARRAGVEITHEAAVGKISDKEINYLMTRRLSHDEAVSLIVRGFMDVSIMGLPKTLSDEMNSIVDLVASSAI